MFDPQIQPCKTLGEGFFLREPTVAAVVEWQGKFADKMDGLADATAAAAEFVWMLAVDTSGGRAFPTAADVLQRLTFRQLKAVKEECLVFCGLAEDPEDAAKN